MALDVNVYFGPENAEPSTSINFTVPGNGWVRLEVWNATGYRVKLLIDRVLEAQTVQVDWDGKNDHGQRIKSGIYMYRLQWADQVAVQLAPICHTAEECEEMIDEN